MKQAEGARGATISRTFDRAGAAELALRLAAAFLLGRARIFGGIVPFGVAFTAASGGGVWGVTALAGALLGTLTAGSFGWSVKYIAILCLTFASVRFFKSAAPWWFPMAAAFGFTLVIGGVYALDSGWEVTATVMWVVESFLAGGFTYFYETALTVTRDRVERALRPSRAASVILLGATLLLSLASFTLFGALSLGRTAAVLCVLAVTCRGGMGAGCVTGAALGAAMDLAQGGMPFFTLSYTFSALAAGVFSREGRLTFTLSWVASTAVTVLWFWQFYRWFPALFETFAASVCFMLLPEELLARLSAYLPRDGSGYGYLKARDYTRERVEQCSAAFKGLYDSLRARLGQDVAETPALIYDRASDAVCRTCPNSSRCWQEEYVETLDVMNAMTPVLEKKGQVEPADLPERFTRRCNRLERLLAQINAEARAYLTRRSFQARLRESRGAAYEQYGEIARVLASLSGELGGEIRVEPELEKRLRKYLRGLAMDASVAVFRLRGGRLRAEIRSQSLRLLKRDRHWLDNLSSVLGVRLCAPEGQEDGRLILLEAEPLAVTVGSAAAKKSGETVSGDRCLCFRTDEGMLYVLLSDGMGAGPEAARMASDAASVTQRFLRAGIAPELTLDILSSLCLLKNEDSLESATVDLLALDMFSGEAKLYKYGAAPSYLRRGTAVKRVGGSTLPVGFAAKGADKAVTRLSLQAGDTLLMASDGVGDEKLLRQHLASCQDDPQLLARALLGDAAKAPAQDDMTVIVVKVETRE